MGFSMKNLLLAILSVVYLAATTGVGVEQHFCCGKLSNMELTFKDHSATASERCMMKAFVNDKGCCKDVFKVVKISQNQTAVTEFTWTPPPSFSIILPFLHEGHGLDFSSISVNCLLFHSPPLPPAIHPYLKNRTFLI